MAGTMHAKLDAIPDVEIDESGVFKYVLIKLYIDDGSADEKFKLIVRGNGRGEFHADIYEELYDRVRALGLDTECVGGGRIQHDPHQKKIHIYGYSQGYGRADHAKAKALLTTAFPHYTDITWSNDGY
ncbi:hypothetical protein CAPTEDRAFT_148979 [Capitella teleta]|uniref:Uncharacterized protein n=1 Tax=Capitella teleta TaxID=283909 RepID=R7U055_CAPTE|nr:hypothetical protein CAPTEDRAFT_148979 [Capitella teleta]|eukprot:ELT97046.1 hypothetical protein CAPTEDRAFT_148979 [Capitella teleta]